MLHINDDVMKGKWSLIKKKKVKWRWE